MRLSRADHFRISHGRYINNAANGIYPIRSAHGLINSNDVSGSDDSGTYVGSSSDILIEKNISRDCTIGIEVQTCSRIDVGGNKATGNTVGILVQVIPGRAERATTDINVTDNVLHRNNRPNPLTDPSQMVSRLPSGIGLLNIAGDRVIARRNEANHNDSAGIAVVQLPPEIAALDPLLNPYPDGNEIRDNVVLHNGGAPDPKVAPLPGAICCGICRGRVTAGPAISIRLHSPHPCPPAHETVPLGAFHLRTAHRRRGFSRSITFSTGRQRAIHHPTLL